MRKSRLTFTIICLTASILWPARSVLSRLPPHPAGTFAGSWDVAKARSVPWGDSISQTKPSFHEEILHGRISFKEGGMEGPGIFENCNDPTYKIVDGLPREYLFQGAFMNPDITSDTDPVSLAKELGHDGGKIIRLEMNCGNKDTSMDFDMLTDDLIIFILDNVIYTMTRAKPYKSYPL